MKRVFDELDPKILDQFKVHPDLRKLLASQDPVAIECHYDDHMMRHYSWTYLETIESPGPYSDDIFIAQRQLVFRCLKRLKPDVGHQKRAA